MNLRNAARRALPSKAERQARRYDSLTVRVAARALEPTSNAVDIGAHAGDILGRLVEIAPDGDHHAFEPLPSFAASLRSAFPNVVVHEVALAEAAGQVTFRHVTGAPALSGFDRRPWDTYDEAMVETITVNVTTLDDALPAEYRPEFVKVDVENAELRVFQGARRTLTTHRPLIVFEVGNRFEEVFALLDGFGYSINLLDRWLTDQSPLNAAERTAARRSDYYFVAQPVHQ